MKWWLIWLIFLSAVLLASCAPEQPQPQYRHGVPPSVYVAPPWMYSTVLRRNKQGKLERVRVRVPVQRTTPTAAAPAPVAVEDTAGYVPLPPEPSQPDAKIENDLNDIQQRVNEIRRKMQQEPSADDVRVR